MSKVKFADAYNEDFYYFNRAAMQFGGCWYSDCSDGWYTSLFEVSEDGTCREIDGGLWEVEVDDSPDEYIIGGYVSPREVCENEMTFDSDCVEVDIRIFSMVQDLADTTFWIERDQKEIDEAYKQLSARQREVDDTCQELGDAFEELMEELSIK